MKRLPAVLLVAVLLALVAAPDALANHAVFESERYDSPEEAPFVEVVVFLTDTGGERRPGPGEYVEYRTEDVDATAGADYRATAGRVQFEVGDDSKTIRIPLLDDDRSEGVEVFTVHARNTLGGAPSMTTVYLEDGEGPAEPEGVGSPEGGSTDAAASSVAPQAEGNSHVVNDASGAATRSPQPSPGAPEAPLQEGTGFYLSTGTQDARGADEPTTSSAPLWPALGGAAVVVVTAAGAWRSRNRWSPTRS